MERARTQPAERNSGRCLCRVDARRQPMRRLITLLRRELAAFYQAPIAYVILFFFLILNGLSFWFALALLSRGPSELTVTQGFFNSVFFWMAYLLVFPVITMRL